MKKKKTAEINNERTTKKMIQYKTKIFKDTEQTAHAVVDLIQAQSGQRQQSGQYFNIALSGGSTPRLLFEMMAQEPYASDISWDVIRLFWVDERCVAPDHVESNYKMTYDALLKHGLIKPDNIFRMKGEAFPPEEALRYEKLLKKELPLVNGFPVFDLILLGMGEDGHTASIFPDNMGLLHTDRVVETAVHPVSGQDRITLTGKAINHARQVVFLVTGAGKAAIVQTILQKQSGSQQYPAAHVGNYEQTAEFYLDEAAAAGVL